MLNLKAIMTQVEAELTATASDKKAAKRATREEQVLFYTTQKALKDAKNVSTTAREFQNLADTDHLSGLISTEKWKFITDCVEQLTASDPSAILSKLKADADTILKKIRACTTGRDYANTATAKYEQCLVQLYNYVELAVDGVGTITNMFGCFESCGVFAAKFTAAGVRTVAQLEQEQGKEAEFVREFTSAVPIAQVTSSTFASAKLAELSDVVNGINYVKLGAETEEEALQKVRAIMHGVMYESDWNSLTELTAIAKLMEAVKRFFQENGIDSTKQLPALGLDIAWSEQFRNLSKKSKKLYKQTISWNNGTLQLKLDVTVKQADRLGKATHQWIKVDGKSVPKVNHETGGVEHFGVLNDATSLVRDRVMNYATNEINKIGANIKDLFMDEQVRMACVESWTTFQRTHAAMADRIKSALAMNRAWVQSFTQQAAKALEAANGVENDPMYEAAVKALKEKRSAMQKALRNQLRLEYRANKVSPHDISQVLFGCVLAGKSEYEDLESSFGSFLQEEYALFVLQWSKKLDLPVATTLETQVDDCLLPDGYVAETNEDGLIVVDGEIVGELRDELPAGQYAIVERNGKVYAQAEIAQLLEAAINELDASTAQGVVLKLIFKDGTNPYKLLSQLMNQQLAVVSARSTFTINLSGGRTIRQEGKYETHLLNANGQKFEVFAEGKSPLNGLNGTITNGMVTRLDKQTGELEEQIDGSLQAVTEAQYSVYVILQG